MKQSIETVNLNSAATLFPAFLPRSMWPCATSTCRPQVLSTQKSPNLCSFCFDLPSSFLPRRIVFHLRCQNYTGDSCTASLDLPSASQMKKRAIIRRVGQGGAVKMEAEGDCGHLHLRPDLHTTPQMPDELLLKSRLQLPCALIQNRHVWHRTQPTTSLSWFGLSLQSVRHCLFGYDSSGTSCFCCPFSCVMNIRVCSKVQPLQFMLLLLLCHSCSNSAFYRKAYSFQSPGICGLQIRLSSLLFCQCKHNTKTGDC